MNYKPLVFAGLMCLSLVACEQEKPAPSKDQAQTSAAIEVLKNQCGKLFDLYASDILNIEASVVDIDESGCEYDYRCADLGWKTQVFIDVRLKEKLSKIPASFYASGHTLHYIMSANGHSGIVSQKPQSQLVCDWQPLEDGSDVFIAAKF